MGDLKCECGEVFENKGALKSHQNFCDESDRQAPDISYNKVECPKCGDLVAETQLENHKNSKTCNSGGTFKTLRKEGLDKKFHLKREWKTEDGDYQCPECDEVHSKMGMINHYYKKHTEDGRRLCEGLGNHNEGLIEKMNKAKREKGFLNQFEKAKTLNNPVPDSNAPSGEEHYLYGKSHDKEFKEKISHKVKKWYKNNPDSHPWKNKDKFKSQPCEKLKQKLQDEGFTFEEEFQPLTNRFFSIDIAFPKKKFGIEVNGKQHYKNYNSIEKVQLGIKGLGDYYQKRHKILEENGWKILELYYKEVFNPNITKKIQDYLSP